MRSTATGHTRLKSVRPPQLHVLAERRSSHAGTFASISDEMLAIMTGRWPVGQLLDHRTWGKPLSLYTKAVKSAAFAFLCHRLALQGRFELCRIDALRYQFGQARIVFLFLLQYALLRVQISDFREQLPISDQQAVRTGRLDYLMQPSHVQILTLGIFRSRPLIWQIVQPVVSAG